MNKAVIAIIVIVILLGGAYVGYKAVHHFSKPTPMTTGSTKMMKPSPTSLMMASPSGEMMMQATGSAMNGPVKEITVAGSNYKFEPSTITVKKGDHVKITFTNSGGLHDFMIDEFNVATPKIPAGQSTTVEFTADKAGIFKYYCSVGNHRAMGMEGTLTVQ